MNFGKSKGRKFGKTYIEHKYIFIEDERNFRDQEESNGVTFLFNETCNQETYFATIKKPILSMVNGNNFFARKRVIKKPVVVEMETFKEINFEGDDDTHRNTIFSNILTTNIGCRMNFFDELEDVHSNIIDSAKIRELSTHLPAETVGETWQLVYSTDTDGWSLGTLYRKMSQSSGGCCLLIIEDFNNEIFGAMCNTRIRKSRYHYGNWLTFIFRWSPYFEKFSSSQRYPYFLDGNSEYFAIGCPKNAIRLEKDLFSGSTFACDTFDSPPLGNSEYFDVLKLEVWDL